MAKNSSIILPRQHTWGITQVFGWKLPVFNDYFQQEHKISKKTETVTAYIRGFLCFFSPTIGKTTRQNEKK